MQVPNKFAMTIGPASSSDKECTIIRINILAMAVRRLEIVKRKIMIELEPIFYDNINMLLIPSTIKYFGYYRGSKTYHINKRFSKAL